MDAVTYMGARDTEERIRHGRAMPPRVFADLAAATAYTLSSIDKAREVIEAQKKDLRYEDERLAFLANDALEKLGGMRSRISGLVLTPGVDNGESTRFMDASRELGRSAAREEVRRIRKTYILRLGYLVNLILASLGAYFLSNTIGKKGSQFLAIFPFMCSIFWGVFEGSVKDDKEIFEKKRKLAGEMKRASTFISKVVQGVPVGMT